MTFLYAFLGLTVLMVSPIFISISAYLDVNRKIAFVDVKILGVKVVKSALYEKENRIMLKRKNKTKEFEIGGGSLPILKAFRVIGLDVSANISMTDAADTALICGFLNGFSTKSASISVVPNYDGRAAALINAKLYLIPIIGVIYGIRTVKKYV